MGVEVTTCNGIYGDGVKAGVTLMTPNLLKRLKCEFKMKTTEKYEVGAHSLARNTLGVKGCAGASRWDLED